MVAAWDRRSDKDQRQVRDDLLAEWLPQALTFAPFWARAAAQHGVEVGPRGDLATLLRVPPSLQADVLGGNGAGTELVQRPSESQVKSAGSTSLLLRIARNIGEDDREGKRRTLLEEFKPVHVVRAGVADQLALASSRADLDRAHRAGARAAAVLGLADQDYLVSAVPAGPSSAFWGVHALALGASMLALHPRGHGDGLDACVEAFRLLPATVVVVPVGEAEAWAEEVARADADVSRVTTVVVVGPVDDDQRQRIRAAWRASGALENELVVRSVWAPDVSRVLWAECREGAHGYHTQPDLELLEVLDGVDGTPTEGAGDLALTSLGWAGTTLLRYRTGALVQPLQYGTCPGCGRTVPRVPADVVDDAWDVRLRRGDLDVHLDLRALGLALDGTGVPAWRVELLPPADDAASHDRVVVEVAGSGVDRTAVSTAVLRGTGIAPDEVRTGGEAAAVDAAAVAAGSVFADLRGD